MRIVAGLSFVEPVCAALGLDPLQRDLQLLDATLLADVPAAALMGAVLPTVPALVAQVYNRRLAGGVKLALSEFYPDDWEITVVRWAGCPSRRHRAHAARGPRPQRPRRPPDDDLRAAARSDRGAARAGGAAPHRGAAARARWLPVGPRADAPTLRKYVLEEAYEVAEVLDEWDGSPEMAEKLAEELGDLLLQVYLQAEIGDEEDLFPLADVYQHITEKLIRRHPHVFGDVQVKDAEHVVRNWEAIKRQERAVAARRRARERAARRASQRARALPGV